MEQFVTEVFSNYAYSPWLVYSAICFFMLLSAFGMPIPEEVILVSSGFVGYMALNPQLYPPPEGATTRVNVYILAAIAFFAVMASDFLIYTLGKTFGPKLFKKKLFARLVSDKSLAKIQKWTQKYGYWAVLIFRFTPGVRFPGHLMCGAMGLSPWRFLAVDTIAAGFSVPSQVLLVSFYGDYILQYLKQFKLIVFTIIGVGLIGVLIYKYLQRRGFIKSNELI